MKKIRLNPLSQLYLLAFLIFSMACSKKDTIAPDNVTSVLIKEGDDPKVLQIDGETLSISLSFAQPLFSEGVFYDDGFRRITMYDAIIKINDQTINFRTQSELDNKNKNIEKDWNRLKRTYAGIQPLGAFQIGVSDLYPEKGSDYQTENKYLIKLLIKQFP